MLASFANRKFYHAEKGQPGMGSMCHGRNGRDMRLFVPCGTSVIDVADKFVIKDLTRPGEEFVVARGGKGGYGNARFKSSVNQAPRERQRGADGESRHVILELKSIADVGLIGKPNAGKSTLLSRISSARPEVADYPFTTKHPNLGIVDVDADRSFVMADIPGLIEGAAENRGLGHRFLRHVERCRMLLIVLDGAGLDERDPVEDYRVLLNELALYDKKLADKQKIVAVNKSDLPEFAENFKRIQKAVDSRVFPICAELGEGLDGLVDALFEASAG